MSNGRDGDRDPWAAAAPIVAAGVAAWWLIQTFPQVIAGAITGGLIGGVAALVIEQVMREPSWLRFLAPRLIASGFIAALIYYLVSGPLGADVQMRRFNRAWDAAGIDPGVAVHHPWAVLPLGGAAALLAAGLVMWGMWRAGK